LVSAFFQTPHFAEQLPIRRPPPSDVLDETHDRAFLGRRVDHDRWHGGVAQGGDCLKPTLTAHQVVVSSIGIGLTSGQGDWLLEPNLVDARDNGFEGHLVPRSRVCDSDFADGNELDALCFHAASSMAWRRERLKKNDKSSKR